jgi:hypothetical protein
MGAEMHLSIEPPSGAAAAVTAQSVVDLWTELRRHLGRRSSELNAEIRAYPSPIARCDDQLPKLLEQRARAVRLLHAAIELDAQVAASAVEATWLERLQEFLSGPDAATDDDAETELRSRLSVALAWKRHEANKE